jgi:exopolyphosphatase / guanosine-5'-triphosphate,3'-diphosphate pyrophosphatase
MAAWFAKDARASRYDGAAMNPAHTTSGNANLAAIDLGSNSFRLEVARVVDGHIERLDYLKETVRQGDLGDSRNLSVEAMERGVRCLERFGERLRAFMPSQVRAVATQTLREAKNRDEFLSIAQSALGFPIEVVSGVEEARLIYEGVSRNLPELGETRLVVDIGGRSTEFVLGQGHESRQLESHRVGSVLWTSKYFADGTLSESNFARAQLAATSFLEPLQVSFGRDLWQRAYGSSGTIGAVAEILTHAGFEPQNVDAQGLDWLRAQMLRAGDVNKLRLEGLKEERKAVLPGGVAVLFAVFEVLRIERMHASKGSLRHGVLYELADQLGLSTRITSDAAPARVGLDVRDRAVARLQARMGLDTRQALRVAKTALALHAQLVTAHGHDADATSPHTQRQLGWAALLHEAGLSISHTDSHRHGAYIVANCDLAGFSQGEQSRISQLILGQRGKLKKLDAQLADDRLADQLVSMRLAAILCHARRDPDTGPLALRPIPQGWALHWPRTLAQAWPQTDFLLRGECAAWDKLGRVFVLYEA